MTRKTEIREMEIFPKVIGEELFAEHELRIMDRQAGDLKLKWNPAIKKQVHAASAAFRTAQKKGIRFYSVSESGDQGQRIDTFDPEEKRIVGIMPIVGG